MMLTTAVVQQDGEDRSLVPDPGSALHWPLPERASSVHSRTTGSLGAAVVTDLASISLGAEETELGRERIIQ